jgi:hypothetical protein
MDDGWMMDDDGWMMDDDGRRRLDSEKQNPKQQQHQGC